MEYLVRRFVENDWPDDNTEFSSIMEWKANSITRGLRIENDVLSWWLIKDLDELTEIAISIASVFKSSSRVFVIAVPYSDIKEQDIEIEFSDKDALTAVKDFRDRHYNLSNLSIGKLVKLAELVALNARKSENRKTVSFKDILSEIKSLKEQEKLDIQLLGEAYNKI